MAIRLRERQRRRPPPPEPPRRTDEGLELWQDADSEFQIDPNDLPARSIKNSSGLVVFDAVWLLVRSKSYSQFIRDLKAESPTSNSCQSRKLMERSDLHTAGGKHITLLLICD